MTGTPPTPPRPLSTQLDRRVSSQGIVVANVMFFLMLLNSLVSWLWLPEQRLQWTSNGLGVFSEHRWWLLETSLWLHQDPGHLISNLLGLFVFGFFIFGFLTFSWRHSLLLVVLLWLGGALVQALTLLTLPPETYLLGASGVVFEMLGFWLVHYLFIARQRSWRGRILRVLALSLLLLFPEKFSPEISFTAHALGLLVGFGMGGIHFSLFKQHYRDQEIFPLVSETEPQPLS